MARDFHGYGGADTAGAIHVSRGGPPEIVEVKPGYAGFLACGFPCLSDRASSVLSGGSPGFGALVLFVTARL